MIFVTALPHPKGPEMQKTTFVCRNCNRTWSYTLSVAMATAYAASHAGSSNWQTAEPPPNDVKLCGELSFSPQL
jgi:hypothetical protein